MKNQKLSSEDKKNLLLAGIRKGSGLWALITTINLINKKDNGKQQRT